MNTVNVLLGQAAMNLVQTGKDITSYTLLRELEAMQERGQYEAGSEALFSARLLLKGGSRSVDAERSVNGHDDQAAALRKRP